VSRAEEYADRKGFDPAFLGRNVPLPRLSNAVRAKAFQQAGVAGSAAYELKYHHFSVVMNREARLAFVSAVNLDAAAKHRQTREGADRWTYDPRIDREFQAGAEFYSDNPLDRGHLVRRADAAWGATESEASRANDDTFHFTNCAPQDEIFNQARKAQKEHLLLWGNIEEHIAAQAAAEHQRLSIFNGPVFRSTDRIHRGLRIPKEFWKVVAYVRPKNRQLRAVAFILSQQGLIANLPLEEFTVGPYRPYQVKLREIEARTKLDFRELHGADPLDEDGANPAFEEGSDAVPLDRVEDIIL
jgi:endonuclease G, mitochondrial